MAFLTCFRRPARHFQCSHRSSPVALTWVGWRLSGIRAEAFGPKSVTVRWATNTLSWMCHNWSLASSLLLSIHFCDQTKHLARSTTSWRLKKCTKQKTEPLQPLTDSSDKFLKIVNVQHIFILRRPILCRDNLSCSPKVLYPLYLACMNWLTGQTHYWTKTAIIAQSYWQSLAVAHLSDE